MGLKFKYNAKEEVPGEVAALYAEREGAWQLEVEGAADGAKLEALQNSHRALARERDELQRRLAGGESEQVRAVAAERDGLLARLSAIEIDQAVAAEAGKRGLRGTAGPDIMARARKVFRLVNGAPVAFEADGKTGRVGKDGVSPLTVAEWMEGQVGEAPHLFEGNTGGGASGGGAGGIAGRGAGIRNPFRRETWNLTEQMRLQKTNPGLAARLRAAVN